MQIAIAYLVLNILMSSDGRKQQDTTSAAYIVVRDTVPTVLEEKISEVVLTVNQ